MISTSALAVKFDIKDIGKLHYFVGIKVLQDDKSKSIWIGWPVNTNDLLKKFGMQDCKAVGTPVDVSTKLVTTINNDETVDQQLYQSAIGSLLYCQSVQDLTSHMLLALWKNSSQSLPNSTGQL